MPLTSITATLDDTIRCTLNDLSSETNITENASISFATLFTAGSTLLATIYATATSSITLSSLKLYSYYSRSQLLQNQLNLTKETESSSPSQSEIVSITGALIVFTVLLITILLTHVLDAIDDFTRKCCKIKLSNLVQIHVGKNVRHFFDSTYSFLIDLIISTISKSNLLTSLFIEEKKLSKNINPNSFEINENSDLNLQQNDETIENERFCLKQRKWSTWFAGQLRKHL